MKCPLCHSTSPSELFECSNPRSLGPRHLSYLECRTCKLVFLSPPIPSTVLSKIYSTRRYFTKLCQSTHRVLLDKILQLRLFPEYHQYVSTQVTGPQKLLDIGCGNGEFLFLMKSLGWHVSGLDPSKISISNARKLLGPQVTLKVSAIRPGLFKPQFDVVTMWHVLEHVSNPPEFLATIKSYLKPGGKLILEVPNSDSILLRTFKSHYNWLMVPEHVMYYSPTSLTYLFSTGGFHSLRFDHPPRALLNFALSISKIYSPLLLLTVPFSIVSGFFLAIIHKGEVVRLIASK